MSWVSAVKTAGSFQVVTKMNKKNTAKRMWQSGVCHTLYFWPLIVAGGRIVARAILNIWNMIEPGGAQIQ